MKKSIAPLLLGLFCLPAMSADIYSARKAYLDKNLPVAFAQFKELAELGSAEAQENLAVMYVNGEGVARSNVLAYAWASLAIEQGGGDAVKGVVTQLDPHLNDAMRKRVAEIHAQFGQKALQARTLPEYASAASMAKREGCRIAAPAKTAEYYPEEALRKGLSGRVLVEVPIAFDGRARNPRTIYALPPGVFDDAVRWVAINTQYEPGTQDGKPAPCTLRYFIKFSMPGADWTELREKFEGTRQKALAGDPAAQFTYGLLLNANSELDTKGEDPLTWFLKAAQAGIPAAQFMVGSYLASSGNLERDPAKAMFWYEKAASQGQVSAQLAMANYLLRTESTREEHVRAAALLEQAVAAGSRNGHLYLAAALAASPDPELRNPARALALVESLKDIQDEPVAFEIMAAAHAMLGQFGDAKSVQKKAIVVARRMGWDVAPLQARLARFEAGQTWSGELMLY